MSRRFLTPCLERDFLWTGFLGQKLGNWTTWINSNWLTAALILEQDEPRRRALVYRSLQSIDCLLAQYPQDGGCVEGPGYWRQAAGSLFDCLELLRSATNAGIDIYQSPLVREMGRYLYRAHIAGDYFTNYADAPGKFQIPADLVFRFGKRIEDPRLTAFGAWGAKNQRTTLAGSIGRQLPAIFNTRELQSALPAQPLIRDVWLPDIQVMGARSQGGSAKGLFVSVKGGNNGEGHNHNDVGSFMVYADGRPVFIDVGPEYYTATNSSLQHRVAVARQIPVSLIVGHDENDIRPLRTAIVRLLHTLHQKRRNYDT